MGLHIWNTKRLRRVRFMVPDGGIVKFRNRFIICDVPNLSTFSPKTIVVFLLPLPFVFMLWFYSYFRVIVSVLLCFGKFGKTECANVIRDAFTTSPRSVEEQNYYELQRFFICLKETCFILMFPLFGRIHCAQDQYGSTGCTVIPKTLFLRLGQNYCFTSW